ncbi:MAG: hypothetical protein GXP27_13200 [Planctomycetes bacterium]|nr:hypothetical protein [Planctomycetota bacterium]
MAAPALAADKDERADKVVFDRLVREMRQTHQKYAVAYQRAVTEARDNDGKATLETKAEILSLRDEIDRKTTRLLLIALRHGWEVPRFDVDNPGSPEPVTSQKERIFSPVDDLIRTAFAAEARQLAAKVRLPVVSIRAAKSDKPKESKFRLPNLLARKEG